MYRVTEKSHDLATVWQTDGTVSVDAVFAVGDAIETVGANHPTVAITTQLPDSLMLDAHPWIRMAFEEALDNAARHNDDGVSVDVTATVTDSTATLRFSDTESASPIPRSHHSSADTSAPSTTPRGIGLWFIYWRVDHSDGTLTFTESNAGGTVVEMTLRAA